MAGLKAIIVDDARFIRELVTKILHDAFPESVVKAAESGDAGKKLLSQENFDIVLCDWEMPGMSGLELLQWTRQQPSYQTVPFLMITSRGEREYVLKAVSSGVNDYIGKPFEPQQLIDKVKTWLEKGGETSPAARQRAAQLLASAKSPAAKKAAPKPKGMAQLRVGSHSHKCAVKELTLQYAKVAIKNENELPAIFQQAVIDIEQPNGKDVARINGFIRGMHALEADLNSNFVDVTIHFSDNDADKMEVLSRYMSAMK